MTEPNERQGVPSDLLSRTPTMIVRPVFGGCSGSGSAYDNCRPLAFGIDCVVLEPPEADIGVTDQVAVAFTDQGEITSIE